MRETPPDADDNRDLASRVRDDVLDSLDEELELDLDDQRHGGGTEGGSTLDRPT